MSEEQVIHTISFGLHREKGPVRQENQDQIAHFQSSVFGYVFVVADGMGGHEGGGIAANMAITGFKQHFQSVSLHMSLRESISEAARLTNLDIFDTSNENGDNANPLRMGSTLVLCVVAGNFCTVASAGDSRCYSFRNGELRRLTKDHTAVQKMVDSGIISADEAKNHPEASVLTRAFGQRPDIEIDISDPFALSPDEKLLLCSDGLHGYVDEAAIAESLQKHSDPQAAADALLQLALEAGGQDNISIFVIRVDPPTRRPGTAPDPPIEAEANGEAAPAVVPEAEPAKLVSSGAHSSPKSGQFAPGRRKTGRRVALALLVLANIIAAGALIVLLRPSLIPVAVRKWLATVQAPAAIHDRLAVWGIIAEDPHVRAVDAPVPGKKADKPVETTTASDPAADTAASTAPVVAPPPIAEPVPTPDVFIAIPKGTNDGFRGEVAGFRDRLSAAGFKPLLSEIPLLPKSVWRFVTANPATFAPSQVFIWAVFLPGFQKDAAKVCGIVICSEPSPREVSPANRKMFEDAFAGGSIAVFVHPKVVRQERLPPVVVPPDRPAAYTKE